MPDPLDGLNASQRTALAHGDGPLLVVGGAGTGKTHVLTRRIAWLVEQGVAPDAVLGLTASSAAAAAMRCRVEAWVERPYEELWIFDFHAFCARLLREEALEAGLDPFFSPVSRADRIALLLERVDDLPLSHHEIRGNPAPLLSSLVARIDRLKDELVTADELRRHAEAGLAAADGDSAARAWAARELELARIFARHDDLLAERGALDFGDLVLRAGRVLHERPGVRDRVASGFSHVLVDDYQELKPAEVTLLRELCAPEANLTVAGDEDQAVSASPTAARASLLEFARHRPAARRLSLTRSHRCGQRILDAAGAVLGGDAAQRPERRLRGRSGRAAGRVAFWRCASERAQAQGVARAAERLIAAEGAAPEKICVLLPSAGAEAGLIASAFEERSIPFRVEGGSAPFERAEVRDILAWLRLLAAPADSSAVVRALTRPPIELRSVDVARLTQLARRRKLDMVAAVRVACDGPQLSPEGRDRALAFLRLHRPAALAFESMRPDAFVHRLIERIGIRQQQLYATQADTAERLVNVGRLSELALDYMRREPDAGVRDFVRHLVAMAEAGVTDEDELVSPPLAKAVRVLSMRAARGREFDHVFVLGLETNRMPGAPREGDREVLATLPETANGGAPSVPESHPSREGEREATRRAHAQRMRALLYVAMTRARRSLTLSLAEKGDGPEAGAGRPSPFLDEARAAVDGEWEAVEEELFGPAEGLHSTFRMMRDEVLDQVARVGGGLSEMRLDTYLDVAQAGARYLELLKVAALIERQKQGQLVSDALPEVNDVLLQGATPEQRELFEASALDDYLREGEREDRRRAEALGPPGEPSLESFLPRRGEGLMLSASDIETYRLCPLKYKFARVFRIPQEPTINQRFGIVVHQVLERFHVQGGGSLDELMQLFDASWRRAGFGDRSDDRQFRARAIAALERYWEADRDEPGEPVWFERSFSFRLGPHLVRGRVDRVDRLPDGGYELIDYKTGKPKTADELREDVQLPLYQMGARESWGLPTAAQSYLYVLEGEKVPVSPSDEELARVRGTVAEVAEGILEQRFEPTPSYEICSFCDYRIACPAAER
jgi:superfamily I DNA/RNA helicase/RecB family exonuclease